MYFTIFFRQCSAMLFVFKSSAGVADLGPGATITLFHDYGEPGNGPGGTGKQVEESCSWWCSVGGFQGSRGGQ